jgi:hypothetical protein
MNGEPFTHNEFENVDSEEFLIEPPPTNGRAMTRSFSAGSAVSTRSKVNSD